MLSDKSPEELADYILKWHGHLERWFAPRAQVAGKRVLVVGSQFGTEALWALRSGASYVLGLDPDACTSDPLKVALARLGMGEKSKDYEFLRGTTHDVGDVGTFDYVISNNVFEHIFGLAHTLASLERFLPDRGGKCVIFADPLFFSSQGHHLRRGSWDHLTMAQGDLEKEIPPPQWAAYRQNLNGMTITSFLEAVREAGMILLDLAIVPDRASDQFAQKRDAITPGLKPMDLCLEGIACTLAFPRNL